MAKQYDPDGRRTIGVLTKPDRIPTGEEDHWLRFIRGEAEHLTNGWFAVKQPSTRDLRDGVTWERAREREKHFFSTTAPWSSETDWYHRFGTHNLTESLSKILSDLIKHRLPEISDELQDLLKETESQIRKLPAAPSDDAQGEIISLISDFARELATYVEGTPDDDGIHQTIRPMNKQFLAEIRATAQKFFPFEKSAKNLYTHPTFLSSEVESGISASSDDVICVDDVMAMADGARARELPGHSLYIVTKRLIKISTEQWDTPSHNLLEEVYDALVERVNEMVDNHFLRFRYGRLYQDVKSIVNNVLAECQTSALERIDKLLVVENKAPFTLHEPEFIEYSEKLLSSYRGGRIPLLHTRWGNNLRAEELAAADPCAQALRYMAGARAYFQIAFKRFTDMVPMMIDQELLRGLDWDRGLNSALTRGLGVTGPGSFDKAMEYLQEPPQIKNRRESLLKKRERLQSAKRELLTI